MTTLLDGTKRKRASDLLASPPIPRLDEPLANAIDNDRIGISFQPQIALATGQVVGAEALARWSGAASATDLFKRAAASNLSERLSRQVQRRALRKAGRWGGALAGLNLSINLLPEDICRSGYGEWLLAEIESSGIDPNRLTVEITESSLLADPAKAAECLGKLRKAGVRIAVDDFGSGYSSLAYLTSLPIDTLKIDQGLIADLVGGKRDQIVVRAMIRLAKELELKVVVEGVETTAQLALLAEWGCDLYQGFLGAGALDDRALSRFVAASFA